MKNLALLLALTAGCLKLNPDLEDSTSPSDDVDGDGVLATEDCDDNDASIYPGAPELCDTLDNDCDGEADDDAADADTWYADTDGDDAGDPENTLRACSRPAGYTEDSSDCDDDDDDVYPGAEELCDGLDNDCDGETDDGTGGSQTFYEDADGDGFGNPDQTEEACAQPPGTADNGDDCDDKDATTNPGADELCDSLDNDCDGEFDEDVVDPPTWYSDYDNDGYGDPSSSSASCEQPPASADNNLDCDDNNKDISPDGTESCDGADNNCDGTVDEEGAVGATAYYTDGDSDGYGDPSSARYTCSQPTGLVASGTDCDDSDPSVSPGAAELCDGFDNNCDSTVDEDSAIDASTWYADNDGDGYGDPGNITRACSLPSGYTNDDSDCDDSDGGISPSAVDACYDGTDSDCGADDDFDCDGDGESIDSSGGDDCDDSDPNINTSATELQDALDNDCDGYCDEDFIQLGDLIISEIMVNPKSVADAAGEWIEIHNPNSYDVRICGGWTIEDNNSSHTISSELLVAAGDYVVLGKESDTAKNGGATIDYVYTSVTLTNTGETLSISFDGNTLDDVNFFGWEAEFPEGKAMQLDRDITDPGGNDDMESWCVGSSTFGKGDGGTPGSINDNCF